MRKMTLVIAVAVFGATALGCRSRLAGYKRPAYMPLGEREKMNGIPITMTHPQFFLTETPAAGGTKYDLSVKWVADPSAGYTVTISPALLTEGDFGLTIGEHGELLTTSSATREQIGPTLESLGSFVGKVVGAASKLAAFDTAGATPVGAQLLAGMEAYSNSSGILIWDESHLPVLEEGLIAPQACMAKAEKRKFNERHWRKTQGTEIADLKSLIADLRKDAVNQHLPFSPVRRMWIDSYRLLLECRIGNGKSKEAQTAIADAEKRLNALIAGLEASKARPPMNDAKNSFYETSMKSLHDAVAKRLPKTWNQALKTPAVKRVVDGLPQADKDKYLSTATAKDFKVLTDNAGDASLPKQLDLVKILTSLDDGSRLLRVMRLERERDYLRRRDVAAGMTAPSPAWVTVRNQWLSAIGAYEEGLQEEKLLELLKGDARPGGLQDDGEARAVRDYGDARVQLAVVRKAISAKRTAMNPPKIKKKPRTVVMEVIDCRAEKAATPTWVKAQVDKKFKGKKSPEFVIVRERGYR